MEIEQYDIIVRLLLATGKYTITQAQKIAASLLNPE